MTPTQYAVISFLQRYHRENEGRTPDYPVVRSAVGKSNATVLRALKALDADGYLNWENGRGKGLGLIVHLTAKELPPPPPPPAPKVEKPIRGRSWHRNRNDEILRRMKARESVATIAEALDIGRWWASKLCQRLAERHDVPWGRRLAQLNADERNRKVARRILEGCDRDEIAREFGLSQHMAANLWRTIGEALVTKGATTYRELGLVTDASRSAEQAEVLRRIEDGQTHEQIAVAMGRTTAWVSHVRGRLGLRVRNYLHISESEHQEIVRRISEGEGTASVAHDIGVDRDTVRTHSASVRGVKRRRRRSARPAPPPMRKARRKIEGRHLSQIEAGLRSGLSMRQIGKRLGFSHSAIQHASRGVRQALTEGGVKCACGQPVGHPRLCAITAISTRTVRKGEISKRHVRHMQERLLAGQTLREIGDAMGFTHPNVAIATRAFREELFDNGVTCGCGKIIGHPHCCKFNIKRRKTWTGGGLTAIGKRRVRLALLEGHHLPDIVRDLDVAELSVLQMRKALTPDERAQRKEAMRDRQVRPANVVRTYEVAEDEYRALIDHVTPYLRDRADRYAKRLETRSKDDLLHDGILTLWSTRHTFKRDFDDRPIEERFRVWANRILYLVFVKAYWADGGGRMRQAPELRAQGGDNERRDFLSDMIVDTTSAALVDEMDLGYDAT